MSYYRNPEDYPQPAFNEFYEALEIAAPFDEVFGLFAHLVSIAGKDHPLVVQAIEALVDVIDANYVPVNRVYEDEAEDYDEEDDEEDYDEDEEDEDEEGWQPVIGRGGKYEQQEPEMYFLSVDVSLHLEKSLEDITSEEIMEGNFDPVMSLYLDLLTDIVGQRPEHYGVSHEGEADFGWDFETLTEAREAERLIQNDPRTSHLQTRVRAV
jgi:hypothetical protein